MGFAILKSVTLIHVTLHTVHVRRRQEEKVRKRRHDTRIATPKHPVHIVVFEFAKAKQGMASLTFRLQQLHSEFSAEGVRKAYEDFNATATEVSETAPSESAGLAVLARCRFVLYFQMTATRARRSWAEGVWSKRSGACFCRFEIGFWLHERRLHAALAA